MALGASLALSVLIMGQSLSLGWPEYLPDGWDVRPEAVGGLGTAEGWSLNFFETRALPQLPADWCTMLYGTLPPQTGVTVPEHEEYLRDIIGRGLANGCGQILLMVAPPVVSPPYVTTNEEIEPYREVSRRLCQQITGVVCGPDLFWLISVNEIEVDGVHLTPMGNEQIDRLVTQAIRQHTRRRPVGH